MAAAFDSLQRLLGRGVVGAGCGAWRVRCSRRSQPDLTLSVTQRGQHLHGHYRILGQSVQSTKRATQTSSICGIWHVAYAMRHACGAVRVPHARGALSAASELKLAHEASTEDDAHRLPPREKGDGECEGHRRTHQTSKQPEVLPVKP